MRDLPFRPEDFSDCESITGPIAGVCSIHDYALGHLIRVLAINGTDYLWKEGADELTCYREIIAGRLANKLGILSIEQKGCRVADSWGILSNVLHNCKCYLHVGWEAREDLVRNRWQDFIHTLIFFDWIGLRDCNSKNSGLLSDGRWIIWDFEKSDFEFKPGYAPWPQSLSSQLATALDLWGSRKSLTITIYEEFAKTIRKVNLSELADTNLGRFQELIDKLEQSRKQLLETGAFEELWKSWIAAPGGPALVSRLQQEVLNAGNECYIELAGNAEILKNVPVNKLFYHGDDDSNGWPQGYMTEGGYRITEGGQAIQQAEGAGQDFLHIVEEETPTEGIERQFAHAISEALAHNIVYQPMKVGGVKWSQPQRQSVDRSNMIIRGLERIGFRLEGSSLLDLGSNTGYFCRTFEACGMIVEGVESHRGFVEVTRLMAGLMGFSHEVYHAPAEEFVESCTKQYDVVFLLNLFHHLVRLIPWTESRARLFAQKVCSLVGSVLILSYNAGGGWMDFAKPSGQAFKDWGGFEQMEYIGKARDSEDMWMLSRKPMALEELVQDNPPPLGDRRRRGYIHDPNVK